MKPEMLFIISLITVASIFDTIRELILKTAINSLKIERYTIKNIIAFILKLIANPWIYLALLFSTFSLFLWLFILTKADLNLAFSLDSMHYIFIAFASGLVLKEKMGSLRWVGTVSIVIGIVLVTLS
ncbi:MAG: EamA family transporter [Candidatus Omnitrophota bacterium]